MGAKNELYDLLLLKSNESTQNLKNYFIRSTYYKKYKSP